MVCQPSQSSDFNPPNWLFAPVWTALYILIGIAAARVWSEQANQGRKGLSIELGFWGAQLVLNFFWSAIFFSLHLLLAAMAEMGALWFVILTTLVFCSGAGTGLPAFCCHPT